ncbi:MAG: ABC transporter substrate-binding protein [Spirochaetia bacterium]
MNRESSTYISLKGLRRGLCTGLLISAGLLLPLYAAAAPSDHYPVTIEDSLGNEFTMEEAPQRVVLAGKATLITANAYYLFEEARDKIVAIGKTNQGLGNFLPHLDGDFEDLTKLSHQVGPEQIIAQRPDLVIVKDFMYKRLGAPLAKLGVPVLALNLESAADYQRDIRILGKVLNQEGRAEEILDIYDERLFELEQISESIPAAEKPRVLMLYYSVRGGDTAFNIPPKNWMQTFQVEAAGGSPVWTDSNLGSGWKTVNFEQIAAWDPDTIVITSYNSAPDNFFEEIIDSPRWQQLRAGREGRVYAFPADFYSWAQPDVRWILGAQWLARSLHPDHFSHINIKSEVRSFYRDMYALSNNSIDSLVLPRLNKALENNTPE